MNSLFLGMLALSLATVARAESISVDLPATTEASQEVGSESSASLEVVDDELDSSGTIVLSKLMFKVGPGWSSLSSYNPDNSNRRKPTAIFISAEAEFPLSYDFSFQTGLNFIQKGNDYYDGIGNFSQTLINYLEIPLLARFNFHISDRHAFSLSVGPYAAMVLSSTLPDDQQFGVDQVGNPISNGLSRFDFGGRFGADFEMLIRSNLSFLVGVNYDLGFSDVVAADDSSSTRALMAGIGLAVKL